MRFLSLETRVPVGLLFDPEALEEKWKLMPERKINQ